MDYRSVFKRYEMKFLMDEGQTEAVCSVLKDRMAHDRFAFSDIRNIYYDTPDFLLARRSNEHPFYKEKLRVRSYGAPDKDVFVELKKKYDGVVYKRRLSMPYDDASGWLSGDKSLEPATQIGSEIGFMMERYPGIAPAMMLDYRRESFCMPDGDLRVTIDTDIRADLWNFDLRSVPSGKSVLPDGHTLMEIKTMGGIPLWLTEAMSSEKVYRSSFSKYGSAYKKIVVGGVHPATVLPDDGREQGRSILSNEVVA